jgi:hypothetical protein
MQCEAAFCMNRNQLRSSCWSPGTSCLVLS